MTAEFDKLLLRVERALLGGDPQATIAAAGVVTEACLTHLLTRNGAASPPNELGPLLREVSTAGLLDAATLRELNWLKPFRNRSVHFGGEPPSLDEALRAQAIVRALLLRVGVLTEDDLVRIASRARLDEAPPPPREHLTLDRTTQKSALGLALEHAPHVLVLLTDGESRQGHAQFGEYARWKLHERFRTSWREVEIPWPAGPAALEVRLGELAERVSGALGGGGTSASWPEILTAMRSRLLADGRSDVFIRHRLVGPAADDLDLLGAYVDSLWRPLATAPAPVRVAVSFELVRSSAGVPLLASSWWIGQRERRVARRIAGLVAEVREGRGKAVVVPELASVEQAELAEWLNGNRGLPPADATRAAANLIAASENGRFELLVERLGAIRGKS